MWQGRFAREGYRLPVGECVTLIREALGWNKKRLAQEAGFVRFTSGIENGREDPSLRVIERIREATGMDPYVLAYMLHYDYSKEPEEVQALYRQLRDFWTAELEMRKKIRHRNPRGYW